MNDNAMGEPNAAADASATGAPQNEPGAPSQPSNPAPQAPWSVAETLAEHRLPAPAVPPATPLPFLHMLERLKTTPRAGWGRFRAKNVRSESIADHMYRMGLLTLLAPPALRRRGLDADRCTRMALVHDVAESLVGDITPVDGVPKEEKSRREAETIDWLTGRLLALDRAPAEGSEPADAADAWGMRAGGREIAALWQEYEEGRTLEAQYVHDVDKVELLLQMVEYERRDGGRVDLGEFLRVGLGIALPEMRALAAEIVGERAEVWKEHGKAPEHEDTAKKVLDRVAEDKRSQGT